MYVLQSDLSLVLYRKTGRPARHEVDEVAEKQPSIVLEKHWTYLTLNQYLTFVAIIENLNRDKYEYGIFM